MATDIKYRINGNRYIGNVIKCLSTEVLGYQYLSGTQLTTVLKSLYQTQDDDKVYLFRTEHSFDLLVEQPRIDIEQPEHLRKVVTDWQATA